MNFGPRRGVYVDISEKLEGLGHGPLAPEQLQHFEQFDALYRAACALLYNYVPMSGHPGGSISSGRFVSGLIFDAMAYDVSQPRREDSDILSYAAGHKALGLYAMWALRDEVARLAAPDLVPSAARDRLRIEDLLGFRRNPTTKTALFKKFGAKPLDGHPTPATPFVRLATGASGVGLASSIGLAFGAADYFGDNAPVVHIVEGEGGMTPGRVGEAMAAAGTACLGNVVLHVDWNQASIDSNRVCRDGEAWGDYVQWTPMEFAYLHDWNVIYVPDGTDFQQIIAAQRFAVSLQTGQPTAIVYRTTKGWQYGIEGKSSHGAGHKLCSKGFYDTLKPLTKDVRVELPTCESSPTACRDGKDGHVLEECFWDALCILREGVARANGMLAGLGGRLHEVRARLNRLARKPRAEAPAVSRVYDTVRKSGPAIPSELALAPGAKTTLRAELGRVLNYLNKGSDGAFFAAAADLLDSTSISKAADGFPQGYYNRKTNAASRLLSIGGICEDAMSGILSGISTFGHHIGAGASYGAFIAPLGHIAARLHAIGSQARNATTGDPYSPFILVCGHAGLKTGEDGPTHADPQPLQLLQENFPHGTMITLTPWDPQELWPLMSAALARRPAIIAPFVTRPTETVLDREALGLAPATAAAKGVYVLRKAKSDPDLIVVLQGSGVTYSFITEALPLLLREGIEVQAYYVASAELFDLLPAGEQERVFPVEHASRAIGITGFTLPTMYRWVASPEGRAATIHPFAGGHYLGSGPAEKVLAEAGLDGATQFRRLVKAMRRGTAAAV